MRMLSKLWADDAGVVSLEYLILGTILGLGLIVGVTTATSALNAEYGELSNAILALSQEYSSTGFSTCNASKEGSAATDSCGNVQMTFPQPQPCDASVRNCP